MKCDKCGKSFKPGNQPNGIPNGIAFQMDDGAMVTVCAECVASFATDEGKRWLDKLDEEHRA